MASGGQTIAGINVALGLQSAAFLRGINQATAATAKATQQMQKDLNLMNNSFIKTGKAVTQFANGFQALFAIQQVGQAVKALADYSDSWQMATNKIAAAEQISGRQARSMSDINKIAIETRSSLDATADLYAKLLRVTGDVADSEEQVAKATRIVAQGFKAGGASTLEMENGIRQLAQALGSGILQGDELRSIRENAPLIAAALAKEFNTTIAGLKQLGAEGKITSDRIFKAILASENEIGMAFGRTTSTIGEGMTNVNNAITQYVGEAGRTSGASKAVAGGLNFIALNFNTMANAIFAGLPGLTIPIIAFAKTWTFLGTTIGNVIDSMDPAKTIQFGDAMQSSADQLWTFSRSIKDTPETLDMIDAALGRIAISGRGATKALPADLWGMANFDPSKVGTFEPFEEKYDQLNSHIKEFAKSVKLTHADLIRDVGSFSEQWIQKLEDIKKKYPSVADEIRATQEAAIEHHQKIQDSLEGFGVIIPLQDKAAQARKKVNDTFTDATLIDKALAAIDRNLAIETQNLATSLGAVLSPAEELATRIRAINAAKEAGEDVGNAVEQSTLRSIDQQMALREQLGLAIAPMEAVEAINRKIAESVGLVATAEELAALNIKTRIDAQNQLTESMGLTVDPIAQFQATMADLNLKKAHDIDVTQAQVGAYARLGGSVLDLAGQASGAFAQMFKDNKAFAIANAVISTAEAIAKTIGTFGATPWGLAAAAVAAAVGAAQIATIVSASPGGAKKPGVKGGGGGGKVKAVSDAGASSTASKSSSASKGADIFKQTVTLVIEGDSFGPEHFKKMVDGLNAVIADGAVLRVGGR